MKKLIVFAGLIFTTHTSLKAQQQTLFTNASAINKAIGKAMPADIYFLKTGYAPAGFSPDKDHDFYLRRSKNQRIVGWATLGGGLLLGGAGILAANSTNTYNNGNTSLPAVLFIASAVSGIASIPFMAMASGNKRKAKAMLNIQKTGVILPSGNGEFIAGINIVIPL